MNFAPYIERAAQLRAQAAETFKKYIAEPAAPVLARVKELMGDSRPDESAGPHIVYALCAVSTLSFLIWAFVSPLDIVSVAQGEVIPSTQVKRVQHLEGGIVSQILVREGMRVGVDQPMIVLAPTSSLADVSELKIRLTSLRVDVARYEALLASVDEPTFDDDIRAENPVLVSQARTAFDIAKQRHLDEIERSNQAVIQKTRAIEEIKTRIRNRQSSLALLREQIAISDGLLKDNLTNRYKHLDLLKDQNNLAGGIEEDKVTLSVAEAALAEATAAQKSIRSTFDNDNRKALDEARLTLQELSQRMGKFKDSFERTTIRSPIEGIVKTVYINTVGGVVKPGEPVVDIVPEGDRLIVEAKLQTHDIGYVAEGQPAVVRLASADGNRFGGLEGRVVSVAPDALLTPDGQPFYKVRIETDSSYFQNKHLRYNLFPGVRVVANIHTGERTVMEYMLDPYLTRLSDAMRER
jgi:adhesin transport system membrane fusion protein